MTNYIIAYCIGKEPKMPEDGPKHMEKFKTLVGGLGDAVVNPGTPLGISKTLTADGVLEDGGSNRLTGFSIVKADRFDSALDMDRACPHLEIGTIEVAEVKGM